MSGSGIRRNPVGGSSSARDAASGSGDAAASLENTRAERSSARTTPPGIPRRLTGRRSATQAASTLQSRASLSPRSSAASPSSPPLSPTEAEHLSKLKALSDRIARAQGFMKNCVDSAQKRRLLLPAYKHLKESRSIFDKLSTSGRAQTSFVQDAISVVNDLLWALSAQQQMNALQELMREAIDPGDPRADQERLRVKESLVQLKEEFRELQDYKQFLQALSKLPEVRESRSSSDDTLSELTNVSLSTEIVMASRNATNALLLSYKRFHTYVSPEVLDQPFNQISRLLGQASILNALQGNTGPEAAQEGYERAQELLQVLVKIGRVSDQFALAAAENWSNDADESEQWQHVLEHADALSAFTSTNLERIEDVARVHEGVLASAAQAEGADEASTSSESTPSTVDAMSPSAAEPSAAEPRRSRRRLRLTRSRPAEEPLPTAAIAAPDPRELALKKADGLRRSHPLTLETVQRLNADVLSIARDRGENCGAIEAMVSGGQEAYNIAHMARDSVRSWFGSVKPLEQCRDEMSVLLEADPSDEVMQVRAAELNNRIEALELIHQRIDADEADALKRHEFPRAQHLQRMLDLDEVDDVAAPIKLPTAQDEGDLGTLFELPIQLKALADGSPAAPLFLHMHASKSVSVEQAMELPFEQFAAVHVKTERQKNLGRRWEEIQQHLGNFDARVHRGKVDSPLLNRLRRMAGVPANIH